MPERTSLGSKLRQILDATSKVRAPRASREHALDPDRSDEWNAWRTRQALRPIGVVEAREPRARRGASTVRYRPLKRAKAAPIVSSERVRVMKGSRTPGFVEVRQGNVPERMAAIRQHPTPAAKRSAVTS